VKSVQEMLLEAKEKESVVLLTNEGSKTIPLKKFISFPTVLILKELVTTRVVSKFVDDGALINDYAVISVVQALKERIDDLEDEISWLR
jgi:hypothetical protein